MERTADQSNPVVQLQGGLARRDRWPAPGRCSLDRAIGVVGTRSALLLMREAFYGTTRFDDFARRVGITEAVASARLKELVAAGLLTRVPYREPGQRTRFEYVLTDAGRDLFPVALAMMQWGDKYVAEDGGPIELTHAGCGQPIAVEVRCAAGHQVGISEVSAAARRPGVGSSD
ncbi:HxlR family transcriptional regulator [Jatrophihabitans sp. GAS493]|uniref:winged helix-turn-helix transcriptional regulator n=1 Tax=Jatrophihabitans sp. GAS493 TaxID=1907575 RepID=UPI000BB8043E|nr:helix-turn-helix domain-containing protein [Jatrophihabitans sp. GAS493]SOD70859.1 HxlR family transcriptional regulator [Jatrophihabitans sp. GAS493]